LRSIIWKPGSIVAPIIGGLLMDWQGFGYIFWIASAFTALGLLLMAGFIFFFAEEVKGGA